MTVTNPINVTASSQINYFSTTANLGATPNIDFIFTSDSVAGSGAGTKLTFRNEGSCTDNGGVCTFRPTFSGNFTFTAGVETTQSHNNPDQGNCTDLDQYGHSHVVGRHRRHRRLSAHGQPARRSSPAPTRTPAARPSTAASLTVGTSSATLGTGNVTVTGGTLSILTGVTNAIADTATLRHLRHRHREPRNRDRRHSLRPFRWAAWPQTNSGTYGSMASGADFQFDQWFTGMGVVTTSRPVASSTAISTKTGKWTRPITSSGARTKARPTCCPNDNGIGGTVGADSLQFVAHELWQPDARRRQWQCQWGGSRTGLVWAGITALLLASGSRRRRS